MCNMERETKTTPAVEVWRPVRDFEGLYEVSNLARVRSVDRWSKYKGSDTKQAFRKGRILRQDKTSAGYYLVTLCRDGVHFHCSVHRLVAEAFVPNPENLQQVNHKDENKSNNLPSNLEWCDRIYNTNYGTGIYRSSSKKRKPIEQLTLAGQHVAYYDSLTEATEANGMKRFGIINVCKGRQKSAYGYQWRYV